MRWGLPYVANEVMMEYAKKIQIARNPDSPPDLLKKLAEDNYWAVRMAVAGNPHTPLEILIRLTIDPDSNVQKALQSNPGLPTNTRRRLGTQVRHKRTG